MKITTDGLGVLFLIIIFGTIVGCGGDSDSDRDDATRAVTENSFAQDEKFKANPTSHTLLTFLEHPDTDEIGADSGELGVDKITYRYTKALNHTFCWNDDDIEASHYMFLTDNKGRNLLTLRPNRECVNATIYSGDYVMSIYHDGMKDKTHPIFIIPNRGRGSQLFNENSVSSKNEIFFISKFIYNIKKFFVRDAVAQATGNVQTLLSNKKCVSCDLSNADLSSQNLPGSNLTGANLEGANLSNSNFSLSDFTGAILSNAKMAYSSFAGAIFKDAVFDGADLGPSSLFSFATWTDGNCKCEPVLFTRNTTDISTNPPVQTIPVSIALSSSPLGNTGVWIANYGSSSVSIMEASTLEVIQSISVGPGPTTLAISPNGLHAYVGREGYGTNIKGGLSIVADDGTYGELFEAVGLTVKPVALGVSADSTKIYVAYENNGLAILDTGGKSSINDIVVSVKMIANVDVGYRPVSLAVSPDGSTIYLVTLSNRLLFISADSFAKLDEVLLSGEPTSIAISPDGKIAYVTQKSGTVAVIDLNTKTVTDNIIVGNDPRSIAVTYDGTLVYVANYGDNNVSVISPYDNSVIGTIKVGNAPISLAVSPEPSQPLCYPFCTYVVNSGSRTISVITPPQGSFYPPSCTTSGGGYCP